jgi:hypothetical protein
LRAVLACSASGVLLLKLPGEARERVAEAGGGTPAGAHVLVVGKLLCASVAAPAAGPAAPPPPLRCVRVNKLVSLSGEPQREAMWSLEVAELWRTAVRLLPPTSAATTPGSA